MLVFLKLGGSLITDKHHPRTPRLDVLERAAAEIASACQNIPEMQLLLGHGSGSFGHVTAQKYNTQQGVRTVEDWRGFAEVWRDARQLNQLVVDTLAAAGLPVVAFPPSAFLPTHQGRIQSCELTPLTEALNHRLIPLVNGDVVFDDALGGTILSTEDVFFFLASQLKPQRILLAGVEPGVWSDYPQCTHIIPEITPANIETLLPVLKGSAATDVTGGMAKKINTMLAVAASQPAVEIVIFTGTQPGLIQQVLRGAHAGTLIHA